MELVTAAVMLADASDVGGHVSLVKLIPVIVLLLLWARLLAWADKDAIVAHMPRESLNTGLFAAMLLAVAGFLFLPFVIGLPLLLVAFLGSAGAYLGFRNKQVGLADLKKNMKNWREMMTPKKTAEAKAGEVSILTKAGPLPSPEAESPDRPAYEAVQELLTDPLKRNAERVELRPAEEGGSRKQYMVDGVMYDVSAMPAELASAAIAYIKKAAGMDVNDRRKPQAGKLKLQRGQKKHEVDVATAGTTAGESMRLTIEPKRVLEHKLDNLGFQSDQLGSLLGSMEARSGMVIVSAPQRQGLTTMLYSILRAHDAFLNHIQTIERVAREDLEGITQTKMGAGASAQEELKQVNWVTSQQPEITMIDEVINPQSARTLLTYAGDAEGKRVYVGTRAGSVFEAIENWRKLVGDDLMALKTVGMVVSGRVLRKLCMACKVAYTPDPDTLRKLNMDPERVDKLYQARSSPLTDQKGRPIPCEFCQDLRYKGRVGVFELFVIDDEVRGAVAAGASTKQLQTIFRKQRNKFLQEQALMLVEAGETSVQEVLRVLKGKQEPPQPSPVLNRAQ